MAAVKDNDPATVTLHGEGGPVAGGPPAAMAMGTNLDGLAYWSSAMPTLDLMKSAGVWLPQAQGAYDTGDIVPLDRDGWPLSATGAPGQRYRWLVANVLHDNPAAPPAALYAVLYDGQAPITALDVDGARVLSRAPGMLHVMAGRTGNLYVRLDAGAGDRVRNIRVVREGALPLYRAGLTFDPDFLARINPFQVLRFMDWMNTNAVFGRTGGGLSGEAIDAAPQLDWADRPPPTAMRWGEGSRGMPVEAMVELANRTGAQPWFTMPINAGDDYVRGFAVYVHAHLRADLAVHVELSNEVWNQIFPQARYARARARAMFGPDGDGLEWYGVRAAQVAGIWKTVFGQSLGHGAGRGRVAMVLGTQFDWRGLETTALETRHWRDGKGATLRAADYVDEYAITGYYDGTMSSDAAVATVQGWWQDADGGYGRALAALRNRIAQVNGPLYRYHALRAKAYGLRLVTYESGFGETTPPSQRDNPAYTDFLTRLQRRPGMADLERANYRAFAAAGGSLFMNFGIIGASSKWGSWSALESVRQTGSPRYGALMGWLAAQRGHDHARILWGGARPIGGSAHGYDVLVGGGGDDLFIAGTGASSRIEGAGGHDTVQLPKRRSSYRFSRGDAPGQTNVTGPTGQLTISGIAEIRFGDGPRVGLARLIGEDAIAARSQRSAAPGQDSAATTAVGRQADETAIPD